MRRVLMVAAAALALSACVATTPRIEEARLQEVRAGTTSYTQIVKHFGTPSLLSKNPDGTSFATYVHADPGASPSAIVPLVAGQHRDSVTFHFDSRGLLTDVRVTSRTGMEARPLDRTEEAVATPPSVASGASAAAKSPPSAASTSATQKKSGGWLWRLPDWLPAAPRENR